MYRSFETLIENIYKWSIALLSESFLTKRSFWRFFLNLKTKICLIFIIFLTIKCTIIRTNKKVSHNHSCLKTDISEEYLIFSCMFHFEKGLIWLNRHTHAASLQTTPLITRLAPVIAIFIRKLQGIAYGINVKKKSTWRNFRFVNRELFSKVRLRNKGLCYT